MIHQPCRAIWYRWHPIGHLILNVKYQSQWSETWNSTSLYKPLHIHVLIEIFDKKFSEKLIVYFSTKWHAPHRKKRRVRQLFCCCVCIRCRVNVFTEPLPLNNRGVRRQIHGLSFVTTWTAEMSYATLSGDSGYSWGNLTESVERQTSSVVWVRESAVRLLNIKRVVLHSNIQFVQQRCLPKAFCSDRLLTDSVVRNRT
jgi:hypothetical protein